MVRTKGSQHRGPTLTRLILEHLAEFGEAMLDAFFPAKYPEARLWRGLLGLDDRYRFRRETFSTILARLQVQGLVERIGRRGESRWRLTAHGRGALRERRRGNRNRPDGVRRLVIFDIPERERKKRDAIRTDLLAAGYRQLQKSVWHGDRPLPKSFLELVGAIGVRRCVHIFSVRDAGTLP